MKKFLGVLIFSLGTLLCLGLWLRSSARRRSTPCPFWLSWLLENPYMDWVASAETVLNRVGLEPSMTVLDVGCGPGRLTIPAAERVGPLGKVVALDIQAEMLVRLRERAHQQKVRNIRYIQAGAGEGRVEPNQFDRVLLVTVLGEILNREAALAELFAALKPGGVLSVTEVIPDPHYQSQITVRQLAGEAGFEEQAIFGNWLAFTLNFEKPA